MRSHSEKPAVGQDAAVGKKVSSWRLANNASKRWRNARRKPASVSSVQHGLIARQISLIAAPLWAQTIHQLTRQVQRVGA